MSEQQKPDPKQDELQAQKQVDKFGWIALVVLVIAVGVGALYFGTDTATAPGNQASTTQSPAQ